jgi:RecA-family ATPase
LPEPSWLLPGLLPAQGLTVLAGRPKVGKYWLALDIALSLAAGREVLGLRPPAEAPTLYIALEDNPRRLKNRLEMARLPAPRDGLITTTFPGMPRALE